VLSPESYEALKKQVRRRMQIDKRVLDTLREQVRPLRSEVRRIQPRNTTALSLVATDGGYLRLRFDPFLIQLVRVVDSSNNEYCLEVISPTATVDEITERQFDPSGKPKTALGEMMACLGVRELPELSHMIRLDGDGNFTSPSWVQVYRELVEWAILLALVRKKDFGTDTLIIYDGLLRSKVFAGYLFIRYREALEEAIERQRVKNNRRIYIAGLAKYSKVLARYRLAMTLEKVLGCSYPCYVEVPRELEEESYRWSEYARGDDRVVEGSEGNRFVAGKMFFVKFGDRPTDPIWPVDVLISQIDEAPILLGYMLADALNGFPVPFYPLCLQRAHEFAALVDFDAEVLQDMVFEGLRSSLGPEGLALDAFRLQEGDPASKRY